MVPFLRRAFPVPIVIKRQRLPPSITGILTRGRLPAASRKYAPQWDEVQGTIRIIRTVPQAVLANLTAWKYGGTPDMWHLMAKNCMGTPATEFYSN